MKEYSINDDQWKTIQTPLLDITCLEQGPADGKPVILLHGWPYDAHTWDAVAGPLAELSWRTLALYLRGCSVSNPLTTSVFQQRTRH